MIIKNYYKILDVKKTASGKEIKLAYYKIARELHPDLNSNNPLKTARLKDINEAYAVLGDLDKRLEYSILLNSKLLNEKLLHKKIRI